MSLGPFGSEYVVEVELHVCTPGIQRDVADHLAMKAYELCPYCSLLRANGKIRLLIIQ